MTVFAALQSALTRLRQPAYTGTNRCLPCTGVNLGLAGLLTAGVWTVSAPAALLVGGGTVATIALRGYLVPGTPELTRRYFPWWLLRAFGKRPAPDLETDPEQLLLDLGVLVEDGEDVGLDPTVSAALAEALPRVGAAPEAALAAMLDVDPGRLALSETGARTIAYVDGQHAGTWDSRTALLTDLAADGLLARRDPDWAERSLPVRAATLAAVRLCLDRCPACDGTVAIGSEGRSTCCQDVKIVTVGCLDCGARLFTTDA